MSRKIILASASPRRKEILTSAGYEFTVLPSDVEENSAAEKPEELVVELATIKARDVEKNLPEDIRNNTDGYIVIGADTLVFLGNRQLGKPASKENWRNDIRDLSGKTHSVITGVCLCYDGKCHGFYSSTEVTVGRISEQELDEFIELGEDMDKAGGYGIQGPFSKFIPRIEGEYNNVVGFPIAKFREVIAQLGIDL